MHYCGKKVRMSLICTRMSSVCHSYALVCHPYATRMYSYVIRMWLVCGFTINLLRVVWPSPLPKSPTNLQSIKNRTYNMIFSHYTQESWNMTFWRLGDISFQVSPELGPWILLGSLHRSPEFPTVSSLAWLGRGFLGQKSFSSPQILLSGSLMNVTFILSFSGVLLWRQEVV